MDFDRPSEITPTGLQLGATVRICLIFHTFKVRIDLQSLLKPCYWKKKSHNKRYLSLVKILREKSYDLNQECLSLLRSRLLKIAWKIGQLRFFFLVCVWGGGGLAFNNRRDLWTLIFFSQMFINSFWSESYFFNKKH